MLSANDNAMSYVQMVKRPVPRQQLYCHQQWRVQTTVFMATMEISQVLVTTCLVLVMSRVALQKASTMMLAILGLCAHS